MTTSVRIVNYGPLKLDLKVSPPNDREKRTWIGTVAAGAVSDLLYIHDGQHLVIEEVKNG